MSSEEWECVIRGEKGECKLYVPKKKGAVLRVVCPTKQKTDQWMEIMKRFADPTEKKRIVVETEEKKE